jgi:glutamine synthetase
MKFIKDEGIQVIDLKFVDLPGLWQHFSVSAREFDESAFTDGVGFDGSSIRGFQEIHESDMLLVPDPNATFVDPFTMVPTLSIICNVQDPVDGKMYSRDPRHIAQKAEAYLKSTGVAERAYFGPEAEFYILDSVRFDQSYNFGYYYIDSEEGFWNSGKEGVNGEKTSATSRVTRKDTSRCRPWTASRTSARR